MMLPLKFLAKIPCLRLHRNRLRLPHQFPLLLLHPLQPHQLLLPQVPALCLAQWRAKL
jgi:hypothetical protein